MNYIYYFQANNNFKVDSGISYYNKLLRRNVILRRVIGEDLDYYIQVVFFIA